MRKAFVRPPTLAHPDCKTQEVKATLNKPRISKIPITKYAWLVQNSLKLFYELPIVSIQELIFDRHTQ